MSAACLLALLLAGDGNRLWWVEVELGRPLDEFTLACGADGTTRVRGPFLAGERQLVVPVPARVPLGREGLALVALPTVAAGEGVRVRGWSPDQPDAELVRAAPALLARGRPPTGASGVRAGRPEVWLCLALLALLLYLRRRLAWFALVALAGGLFLVVRTRARAPESGAEELLDVDLSAGRALLLRAGRDELALPRTRLEARPDGVALEFEYAPRAGAGGQVRARGATLVGLDLAGVPELGPGANGGESLAQVWVRSGAGEWSARGPWPSGGALPGPHAGGQAPPGWLTGALPPGSGILLARTGSGRWLRASGFELPDEFPAQETRDGY